MIQKDIRIEDWAGNVLFEGSHNDTEVLRIMQLNDAPNDDIFVYWVDETETENVYECIDF